MQIYTIKNQFLNIFHVLGIPLSEKTTEGPSHILEYLGIILDTVRMEARLPEEKVKPVQEILENFSNRRSCTKRELLSLLGHLNFACRVIHPGRSFISHLIKLSTTVSKLSHHVYLNHCRSALIMWSEFLKKWNGVSLFLNVEVTFAADINLFTDATDISYGGFYNNHWFQSYFPQSVLREEQTSMAFLNYTPL